MKSDEFSQRSRQVAIMAALAFGLGAPACPQELDAPSLVLSDAGGGCEGASLDKPFANGARLDVDVRHRGSLVSVSEVSLGDPSGWEVIDDAPTTHSLTLRAQRVGTSDLVVRSAGGLEGAVTLEVAPIAASSIRHWSGIQPFNLTADLSPGTADIEAQVAQRGVGLLPDGELRLRALLQDAQGRELGGYDVAGWSAAPAQAVTVSAAGERTNDVVVAHAGGAAEEVVISAVGGGTFTLAVVDAGAARSLGAFSVETGELGIPLRLPVGSTRTIVAFVYDAAGRWLVGNDGQPLDVTLVNDGVASVVPPPWSEGEDALPLDAEATRLLDDNRVFYLKGLREGTTTITLSAAGVALDVPVTITPAELPRN